MRCEEETTSAASRESFGDLVETDLRASDLGLRAKMRRFRETPNIVKLLFWLL